MGMVKYHLASLYKGRIKRACVMSFLKGGCEKNKINAIHYGQKKTGPSRYTAELSPVRTERPAKIKPNLKLHFG